MLVESKTKTKDMENSIKHKSTLSKTDLFILTSPDLNSPEMSLKQRVKRIVSDPAFEEPISKLDRDFSQKGTITLVTKIKNL